MANWAIKGYLLFCTLQKQKCYLSKKASKPYIVKWIERPQKANFKAQSHLPHISVQEELNKHLTNLGSDRRELWRSVIGFLFWKYFETLRGSWNPLRSGFTSDAPEMWVIFMKDFRLAFSQPRLLIGWRLDLFFTFFFGVGVWWTDCPPVNNIVCRSWKDFNFSFRNLSWSRSTAPSFSLVAVVVSETSALRNVV